ncbi:hypothetical protein [Cellulomonas triticagri]|uniref:hypothetical protein n=1 Tax=Cellulomonas triticagri TaxID=2483352 RepID=UPI001315066F|nr:hypothetical protein [Cellulomonas triticagri]
MTETSHHRPAPGALLGWFLLVLTALVAAWVVHDVVVARAATPPDPTAASPQEVPAAEPPQVVVVVVAPDGTAPSGAVPTATVASVPVAEATGEPLRTAPAQDADDASLRGAEAGVASSPAVQAVVTSVVSSWWSVVASDGAVVTVGHDGRLLANTGSPSSGSAVVLDAQTSTVRTGATGPAQPTSTRTAPGTGAAPQTARTTGEVSGSVPGRPQAVLGAPAVPGGADLAGYEDHSVHVTGSGNLVAYDDANLVVDHVGPVNANTGDTDSGAINAVDVTGSVVVTGDVGGSDGADGEEPAEPEEPASGSAAGAVGSAAPPAESLPVVEGDGVDDRSVHVDGTRNVVSDEDTNVVVGGRGPVNAQVGDSDTGGTVAMAVHDSLLVTGCAAGTCGGEG